MQINKLQDLYEITDTYKNQEVSGNVTISSDSTIINLTIGGKEAFCNLFPSNDSFGINITIEQFDPDLINYLIDIANTFINQN